MSQNRTSKQVQDDTWTQDFGWSDNEPQFESFDYGGQSNLYDPTKMGAHLRTSASSSTTSRTTPSYFIPQQPPKPQPFYEDRGPHSLGSTQGGSHEFQDNFEDEPPLLEELGINPRHIVEKTLSVLNPLRNTDAAILQDTDLAGPVVFCVLFGFISLMSGKVHFGYIYGMGATGCTGMYLLLNLMSVAGVSLGVTISVLGYCLLPLVALASLNIFFSLQGFIGIGVTVCAVLWSSFSASKLFVTALAMEKQQPLVCYPCSIIYGVFALLVIF